MSSSPDGVQWSDPTIVRPDCAAGEQFSVWFNGNRVHYAYASGRAGASLYYRSGLLNEDGTIAWSTPEQVIVPGKGKGILSTPCISVDGHGYPWIGYRKVGDQSNKRPMVIKSSKAEGTWSTAPGFPYDLSGWTAAAWVAVPVPLTDGKMLALFTSSGHYVRSKIWKKGIWSNRVMNPSPGIGVSSPHLSVVAQGDDVHLVFLSSTTLIYTKYAYATDRWSPEVRAHSSPVTDTSSPVLSLDGSGYLYLFWAGFPKPNYIYSKRMLGGVWESSPVEVLNESQEKLTGNGFIFGLGAGNGDKRIGYLSGKSSPYRVKFYGGSPSLPALKIKITSPKDGEVFNSSPISVVGEVTHRARVWVNGIETTAANTTFSSSVPLQEGENPIAVEAEDEYKQRDSKQIRVTLLTKGKISGTITDSFTGSPLPSARVEVTDPLNFLHKADTDGQGKYTIDGVSSGPFSGKVTREGYNPHSFSGTLSPGQVLPINAALSPILPKISNVKVSDVTTDSARITWETDQPADGRVDYGQTASYGDMQYDPAMQTTHAFLLSNLKAGATYYYKVTSVNGYGFSSSSDGQAFVTQELSSPIRLNITYPLDGGVLYNAWTRVEGEVVNTLGHETGVVVNGVLAQVYGNRFVANHVPLAGGMNTILVTGTDVKGNQGTVSFGVQRISSEAYIRVSTSRESGLVPLEVLLTIDSSCDPANSLLTSSGPGAVEIVSQSDSEYRIRILVEGIYYFTGRCPGSPGVILEDTVSVVGISKEDLNSLLISKWEGMRGKLGVGELEGALEFFSEDSRQEYQELFNALLSVLPLAAQEMSDIKLINVTNDTAIYDLRTIRGEVEYSFQILFVKDKDGIWQIDAF